MCATASLGAVGVLDRDVVAGPAAGRTDAGVGHDTGGRGAQTGCRPGRRSRTRCGSATRCRPGRNGRRCGSHRPRAGSSCRSPEIWLDVRSRGAFAAGSAVPCARGDPGRLALCRVGGRVQRFLPRLGRLRTGAASAVVSSALSSSSARWSARLSSLAASEVRGAIGARGWSRRLVAVARPAATGGSDPAAGCRRVLGGAGQRDRAGDPRPSTETASAAIPCCSQLLLSSA